jgi:2-amino-4-hydroxy-6-hydroxymethyldihydropteridine diphosphokinase
MARAHIGLNANAGAPEAQLEDAILRLAAHPQIEVTSRSSTIRSKAAKSRQPDFLNLIIGIETNLKARALLDVCLGIETAMGRVHREVWAPRLIDIDIIAYDDIEIRSSRLHLPHPFAHSRDFVLTPLREIAPDVADWVVKVNTRPR